MAGETVERTRTIAAPANAVWAVVGDVTRMPEWSEELAGIELLEGDGRTAGSRFRGNNRNDSTSWSMTCVVDDYQPGRLLAFHTEKDDGEVRTRWWYRLDPSGDQETIVAEGFLRVAKLGRLRALAEKKLLGDRAAYNAKNIDASLERLAVLLEG
jgi:uncharacterized protein YndB with AHSA1/START domain